MFVRPKRDDVRLAVVTVGYDTSVQRYKRGSATLTTAPPPPRCQNNFELNMNMRGSGAYEAATTKSNSAASTSTRSRKNYSDCNTHILHIHTRPQTRTSAIAGRVIMRNFYPYVPVCMSACVRVFASVGGVFCDQPSAVPGQRNTVENVPANRSHRIVRRSAPTISAALRALLDLVRLI